MFLSRNKKNNEYPIKPQFYYIKVGFKGVKTYNTYRHVFMTLLTLLVLNFEYVHLTSCSLGKHAYSNILKILPPKNGSFSDKKF